MKKVCCLLLILLSGCTSPITDAIVALAELPIKLPIAIISGSIKLAKQAFGNSNEDELHLKNIVGKVFEVQKDLFLFKHPEGGFILKHDSDPAKLPVGFENATILGIVKKGTNLRVREISRRRDSFNVQAEIHSPDWKGITVNIGDFFKMVNDLTFEPFNYYLHETD
ncbi:MAG TPA: hypothetical protein VLG76_04600 [Rhabdochlamydiaceae bacterium]|nr:hypothetical protein [Rhabdochlamydiaceae bacterium]